MTDYEKPHILLKPSKPFEGCPFCGSPALHISDEKRREWLIVTHKDGCFFLLDGLPTRTQHISMNEVDAWNRRAN